jgi:hypothetical protein
MHTGAEAAETIHLHVRIATDLDIGVLLGLKHRIGSRQH